MTSRNFDSKYIMKCYFIQSKSGTTKTGCTPISLTSSLALYWVDIPTVFRSGTTAIKCNNKQRWSTIIINSFFLQSMNTAALSWWTAFSFTVSICNWSIVTMLRWISTKAIFGTTQTSRTSAFFTIANCYRPLAVFWCCATTKYED